MKSILILDDDEDTLFFFKHILKSKWQVNTLSHCNNIIENVEAYNPDLIIMDNLIPEEGGLEATKKIKKTEALKNIPVIFSSADLRVESLAKIAGADAWLKKPFEIKELKEQVSKFMQ